MSDRTVDTLIRDVRATVDTTLGAADLDRMMRQGLISEVAEQLIPWMTGPTVVGEVQRSFGSHNGGDILERDELVSEATLILMELLHRWVPGGMSVMNWVKTYGKQRLFAYCIKTLRTDNFTTDMDEEGEQDMATNTPHIVALDVLLHQIRAIRHDVLTTSEQVAFTFYYDRGLTQQHIADNMGISQQRVDQLLKQGVKKIKASSLVNN